MCEIGEKIKPQFKVDLIQFVNATTCCWNKKKAALEGSFMVRGHSKKPHIPDIIFRS